MSKEEILKTKEPSAIGLSTFRKEVVKTRSGRIALRLLGFFIFLAVFGEFIANDKPFFSQRNGKIEFPIFKNYLVQMGMSEFDAEVFREGWKNLKYEKVIWAPIPYNATNLDLKNAQFVSPFGPQDVDSKKYWHWMGTDQLGRDVAAGIIYGTRPALLVGLIAMGIASIIGIFFGAIAGYFGDHKFRLGKISMILIIASIFLGCFWSFNLTTIFPGIIGHSLIKILIRLTLLLGMTFLSYKLGTLLEQKMRLSKSIAIPLDLIIMRIIEVIRSVPGLLLIIAIAALVADSSIYVIMVIIGCFAWTGIAAFIRGEILKVRNLSFIESAESMGFSQFNILWKHVIPNSLGPVVIAIAFGIAGAILTEASLSFIGIGGAIDQVTWGSMINESRRHISAWWIAIIPGMMIFLVITSFNLLGDAFTGVLGKKGEF